MYVLNNLVAVLLLLPVGGENYSSSFFSDTEDAVPQKSFGLWVHTCGGLILTKTLHEYKSREVTTKTDVKARVYMCTI